LVMCILDGSIMKAVILAAGGGSRLKSITCMIPKCLIEIDGIPIIKRQIDILLNYITIEEIIIIIGYKAEMIMNFIEINYEDKPISLIENAKYLEINNMYSLYLAREQVIGEDILIINGDVVFQDELINMIINTEGSVCPYDCINTDPEELRVSFKFDKAHMILPKYSDPTKSDGATIGIFKLSRNASNVLFEDCAKVLDSGKHNEWFEYSLNRIFTITEFLPLNVKDFEWIEVDDLNDLSIANQMFEENKLTF